jgi:hypothetical protein
MKQSVHTLIAFLASNCFVCSVAFAQSKDAKPDASFETITLSAFYSGTGTESDLWDVYLAPDGALWVSVNNLRSKTLSNRSRDPRRVAAVKAALESARFFQLPKEIFPKDGVLLHRPGFHLTATVGNRQWSVYLNDPMRVGAIDERARFFVVWDALFLDLPFKPPHDALR